MSEAGLLVSDLPWEWLASGAMELDCFLGSFGCAKAGGGNVYALAEKGGNLDSFHES